MGDVKGFLKVKRKNPEYRPVCERVKDFKEVTVLRGEIQTKDQASRCMDCGVPFCQWACPVANLIPEWNDLVYWGNWKQAYELLQATNNLPEITGRVCPALCEYSCVLGISDDAVTIRENELAIIERAFEQGYVKSNPPKVRTGKKVAVIGSGPAGLACCDQLNKAGHEVTLFEKDEKIGGLLRYGIPDFKLDKSIIDRRVAVYEQEGIIFKTGVDVGTDITVKELTNDFDAICLTGGSRESRDLNIDGRDLDGIHFAMDFLIQANCRVEGKEFKEDIFISAKEKNVVIIGGGDTGADCVGVSNRQGASCIVQIEVMSKPAENRTEDFPWPEYPMLLKTSTSHEEGAGRQWAVLTKKFIGENGKVTKLKCVQVEFVKESGKPRPVMKEIPDSTFEIPADMIILAVGFLHPEHNKLLAELEVEFDERGNVKADDNFMTNKEGVFAAGDLRRGQSLIVWAIAEGRKAAHYMDTYLMGKKSSLPKA